MRVLQALAAGGLLTAALGTTAMGCLNRPIDRINPRTTSTVVERLQQSGVDKIDLLLAIDNSISMADKQQILAAAVPDLVDRLVTPNCVDEAGAATGEVVGPDGKCPEGSTPEFPPIRNINIGVISSSLGDLTSGACGSASIQHEDDKGRLLSNAGGRIADPVTDFNGLGFLAWDPDNQRGGQTDPDALKADVTDLVVGVDQVGCGYEMQLESVLRFLVDPDPYDSLVEENNRLVEMGTDEVVLEQRRNFLRPDSLLAILILSDENDCSINVKDQGFLALGGPFYRSTSTCETDPEDPCCNSCGLNSDPACDPGGNCDTPKYAPVEDHQNLKCFNQKKRYGVDFLYPTSRYVNAFTQFKIDPDETDYAGDAVDNPLFEDLSGTGGAIRTPDLIFLAGIVGVPWQAIAREDDGGNPDLSLGFKSFTELQTDLTALIGDPDTNLEPTDPFMIQSTVPRAGMSEILGYSPTEPNPINGNDYNIYDTTDPADGPDDLEYACIFPLTTSVPNGPDCNDCDPAEGCNNPLCRSGDIPSSATADTTQYNAKAYPGLRELAVLRGMGEQGIFASICPAEVNNTGSPIYGYRPAVNTIVDRLKVQLGGQCLPRKLTVDPETGEVPCLVIEARELGGGGTCCDPAEGRVEIPETLSDGTTNPTYNAVLAAQQSNFANDDWNCFCEIQQLSTGDAATECRENSDPDNANQGDGWCYIDATTVPPVGNPDLVSTCPADERRLVRFVGAGDPKAGATVFVTCSGE